MSRKPVRKLPRNIRLQQIHVVFLNMIFILPVIVPYYQDVIGIGFREFMIGEAIFSATVVLMEIPTGWLSDLWTRKRAMIVGSLFNCAGYAMLWLADSFFMAVAAQAVIAISVSLLSGTVSALVYDSLLEAGQEKEYRRLEGFRHGLGFYVLAVSCVIGGLLYSYSPRLVAFLSMATTLVSLGAACLMIEPARHKEPVHKNPFADMVKTMRYALHGHIEIAGIIVMSAVLFGATKALLWTQQPYYMLLGLPAVWFGVLTASGFLLAGFGGHFSHKLDGRYGNLPVLGAFMLWAFFVCVIAGAFPGLYAVPLLLTGSLIYGLGYPRVTGAINDRVSSARRATILSTANMMVHVLSIPLLFMMGQVESAHGIRASLLFVALALAVGGLVAGALVYRMRGRSFAA
jgi:MFS family permease